MTMLKALADRYSRLSASGRVGLGERNLVPPPGYSTESISFVAEMSFSGAILDIHDWREAGKRPQPIRLNVPNTLGGRTSGIEAKFLWDKTAYVFGVSATSRRTADEHAAFVAFHERLLAGVTDAGIVAFMRFLRGWCPADYGALRYASEMLDQNITFRLTGEDRLLFEHEQARHVWAEYLSNLPTERGVCLVTGEEARIAPLHPPIKGIAGAQSSGAYIVSFNANAFTSWGHKDGANAPVSEHVVHAYATALNGLLSASDGADPKSGRPRYRNRVGLGDDTVVFWAEAEADLAEQLVALLLAPADERKDQRETNRVRKVFEQMQAGRPIQHAAPELAPNTRVYVLGLSPNAARLSIRFWVDRTLGDLAAHFQEHWADLRLEPMPDIHPPSVWSLLRELAPQRARQRRSSAQESDSNSQRDTENTPSHLAGELTRAVLNGGHYPASLLAQIAMRTRADGQITALRAALAKAVLTRRGRKEAEEAKRRDPAYPTWRDPLVSLNRDETNAGYRLGRLFAVIEYAQWLSVGPINASVRDKFFGSASATPRRVFPSILRTAQYHLSDARKSQEKKRRAGWADAEMKDIVDGLPSAHPFPPNLDLDDQGRFIVGYYHQRNGQKSDINPPADDANAAEASEET